MELRNQHHALNLLKDFVEDTNNLKKELIKEYIEKKFERVELLVALEKLSEYESKIYKKFVLYQSTTTKIEILTLYQNFSTIKKKYQKFIQLYIKNI